MEMIDVSVKRVKLNRKPAESPSKARADDIIGKIVRFEKELPAFTAKSERVNKVRGPISDISAHTNIIV